jgi:LysM repeat protein
MKKHIYIISFFLLGFLYNSCTPLKSSPKEEKHQLELTLHEIQTNLDDLRHDLNCYQTELQILDTKIKHQENSVKTLKQQQVEKQQTELETLSKGVSSIESKFDSIEKKQIATRDDIFKLTSHANETSSALSQYKGKINEIENQVLSQNKKYEEIAKLKITLEALAKYLKQEKANYVAYTVKPGDSLEKIAKRNKINVEALKTFNNLQQDLIVIGQELRIPISSNE